MSDSSSISVDSASETLASGNPKAASVRLVSAEEGHALWAQVYDNQPNPLVALEERVLGPLLTNVAHRDVLDLACGTGRWLAKLLNSGPRSAIGVDLSHEMLREAANKSSLCGRVVRGNAVALPLRSGIRDLAVCSFAAGYIADLRTLARELARVLRAGAELFLTDIHPAGLEHGWKRAFSLVGETLEVANTVRSLDKTIHEFTCEGFTLLRCLEPQFGKPERPIFERSGKAALFEQVADTPALFICHFVLAHPPDEWEA